MARPTVAMTPEEVTAFLAEQTTMTVATLGADGRPHLVAMWFVMIDGCPVFWTFGKSQKAINLRRDARVTCLVEDGSDYGTLRGVEWVGTGEIIDDAVEVAGVGRALAARYGSRMPSSTDGEIEAQAKRRMAVRVTPASIVSWDHRKLVQSPSPESRS